MRQRTTDNIYPDKFNIMKNGRFFWTTYGGLLAIVLLLAAKPMPTEVGKATKEKHPLVFVFNIDKEIAKPIWRTTQQAFAEAESLKADYIIIHLNTYGGRVDVADSIRTKILNSKIPVIVFIDNQAISAGSLISIAADSIYMRPGGSIGAATVVSQTGEALPDKYQSFMRSTMRATAEAHGKDTIIRGNDTIIKWFRDPHIAEAMVDPRIVVKGVIDSGKVLTLTADEAMKVGYCEGIAQNIPEVLKLAGIKNYELKEYKPTALEDIIGFLIEPYCPHNTDYTNHRRNLFRATDTRYRFSPGSGYFSCIAVFCSLISRRTGPKLGNGYIYSWNNIDST